VIFSGVHNPISLHTVAGNASWGKIAKFDQLLSAADNRALGQAGSDLQFNQRPIWAGIGRPHEVEVCPHDLQTFTIALRIAVDGILKLKFPRRVAAGLPFRCRCRFRFLPTGRRHSSPSKTVTASRADGTKPVHSELERREVSWSLVGIVHPLWDATLRGAVLRVLGC
jgi:hypothetical protein